MAHSPLLRQLRKIVRSQASRRDFLKSAAAATALTLPITRAALAWDSVTGPPGQAGSVGVVGAGLAGLTAAYKLAQKGVACELFEASRRVGGRVHTRHDYNSQGMFCEMGGEFVDTGHDALIALASELGVELESFAAADEGLEKIHGFFGGAHRYEKEIIEAFAPLSAHLARDISLVFPDPNAMVINYKTYNEAGARFDRISIADYLADKTDVAPWVRDLVEVAYLIEYGLETREQSAINLLFLISPDTSQGFKPFGASDEALRVRGGNSRLPEALRSALRHRAPIHHGRELVGISDSPRGIRLEFDGGEARVFERVILAIPFSVLRRVRGIERLGLSAVKLRAIRELGYGTNAKHMLGFSRRLWREGAGGVIANNGETYTDLGSQSYWETSRLQPGTKGILTNFTGGHVGDSDSKSRRHRILADLERIQPGLARLYDGSEAVFTPASNPLFRGSYTCPKPGQYTTIYGAAGENELGGRLLFAGEHTSDAYQGFMNGAVETGLRAAQEVKTLAPALGAFA